MKRLSKAQAFLAIVLAVLLFCPFGCRKEEPGGRQVKIGAILPLTGDAAQWGIAPKRGAELAVERINDSGGVNGRRLYLIVEDDRAVPADGVSAIRKLLSTEKVSMIVGSVASSVTLALAPIAEKNKVVLISPASSSPKITDSGDYIFRVMPSDDLRGQIFADYLFHNRKIQHVDILYVNNEGGVGNKNSFCNYFQKYGGTVGLMEQYAQESSDLRTQITKIKNSLSEAMIVVSYPKDTVLILQQSRELGVQKPLYFQTEAVEDPQVLSKAGETAEGIEYILPLQASGPARVEFVNLYHQKYGVGPELFAAEAYDCIMLLAEAVRKQGAVSNISSSLVKEYLYDVRNYEGASGRITFNDKGDVIKPMAIKKIVGGVPQIVETLGG